MSVAFGAARDEMLGLFNVAWLANTPAINGAVAIPVEWPGVASGAPPGADEAWARVSLRHSPAGQITFGATGARRFNRTGLLTVQVFSPLSAGGGLSFAENAAIIARNAFEGVGTASGIWFRNTRIQEIGPDGAWFQMNVVTEFQYDEVL